MKNKVKGHFKRNKKLYLGIGIGVTVVVVFKNANGIKIVKSFNNNNINIEMLGHPGFIVEDTSTGILYGSQNAAAKALGVSRHVLRSHLEGNTPDIHGIKLAVKGINLGGQVAR